MIVQLQRLANFPRCSIQFFRKFGAELDLQILAASYAGFILADLDFHARYVRGALLHILDDFFGLASLLPVYEVISNAPDAVTPAGTHIKGFNFRHVQQGVFNLSYETVFFMNRQVTITPYGDIAPFGFHLGKELHAQIGGAISREYSDGEHNGGKQYFPGVM